MPGIPQGRDVGEHGPKSVTLASVLDDGSITMEERIVSLAQFERVAVDASGVVSWSDLAVRLEKSLGEAARQICIRSPRRATCRFGRDIDGLEYPARCRSPAHRSRGPGGGDRQRMDRENRYRLPSAAVGSAESADPVEALRRTMSDEIAGSLSSRAEADGIVHDFSPSCPRNVDAAWAPDDTGLELLIGRLASEGSEEVPARLAAGSAQEAR